MPTEENKISLKNAVFTPATFQGFAFTPLLSIATTLAICYCVLLVTHKFLPKNLNRWLGFA